MINSNEISYLEYYEYCRSVYAGPKKDDQSIFDLHVEALSPDKPRNNRLIHLPQNYSTVIESLCQRVKSRINARKMLHPSPEIDHFADLLYYFWDLEELEILAEIFIPQIEQNIYGSYALINQINIIRTRPAITIPVSSWIWHYDDNPEVSFKILIYLTEVDEKTGAFEYLVHQESQKGLKISSSKLGFNQKTTQQWAKSRIPDEEIERLKKHEGFIERKVTGPPGTLILFDNNCIHRATVPDNRYRDVVIFNFRPYHQAVRPYISREHTGSWDFNAKNWDPYSLKIR